jgi:hypothetical protein
VGEPATQVRSECGAGEAGPTVRWSRASAAPFSRVSMQPVRPQAQVRGAPSSGCVPGGGLWPHSPAIALAPMRRCRRRYRNRSGSSPARSEATETGRQQTVGQRSLLPDHHDRAVGVAHQFGGPEPAPFARPLSVTKRSMANMTDLGGS